MAVEKRIRPVAVGSSGIASRPSSWWRFIALAAGAVEMTRKANREHRHFAASC